MPRSWGRTRLACSCERREGAHRSGRFGIARRWFAGVLLAGLVLASVGLLTVAPPSSSSPLADGVGSHLAPDVSPTVAVAPIQGPVGSSFNVTGSGFTPDGPSNVTFDLTALVPSGVSDSNCTFSGTTITTNSSGGFVCPFTVPVVGPGAHNVVGTDITTSTASSPVAFTVIPVITVTPSEGWPGLSFTGTGSGFTPNEDATVSFNGDFLDASACSVGSSFQQLITTSSTGAFTCTFPVPTVSPGQYPVVGKDVTTSTSTSPVMFTVTPPAITVTPDQGPVESEVTVAGTGFAVSTEVASLVFDNVTITSCSVGGSLEASSSGTFSCSFHVPSGTSGSTVNATNVGGLYATASFVVTTRAISVTPVQGPIGSPFQVTGSGFNVTSAAEVTFNGAVLTPTGCSVGTLSGTTVTTNETGAFVCTFKVPTESHGAYDVQGKDLESSILTSAVVFTVTLLAITVTPVQGPVGMPVTVSGTGFTVSTALASLVFDKVTIPSCAIGGSLTTGSSGAFSCSFPVPSGTSGSTVNATDVGGQYAIASFVATTPAISVAPVQGPIGSLFQVTGAGFNLSSGAVVTFNGAVLTPTGCSVGILSGTTVTTNGTGAFVCTFKVPTESPASYNVRGKALAPSASTNSVVFTVTALSVSGTPSQGPVGAQVTISGTGFTVSTALASLVFDQVTITNCPNGGSLTTDSAGSFTCSFAVPSGTSGTTVNATDVGGQYGTETFVVTPLAISVTPGQGPVGAPVTVSGTGFSVATTLSSLVLADVHVSCTSGGSLLTNSSGSFACSFAVPGVPSETVTVNATDVGGQFATRSFTVTTPTITPSPGKGPVGTSFVVAGAGFAVSSEVTVTLNGVDLAATGCSSGTLVDTKIMTDSTGRFSCTFVLPNQPGGTYNINATQQPGIPLASSWFVVEPLITFSATSGTVGSTVNVTGTGLTRLTSYIAEWNSTTRLPCKGVTNASGGFACEFSVPVAPAGSHSLSLVYGNMSVNASFSVVPSLALSATSGSVGASVVLTGFGFQANTSYIVDWGASSTICAGATNSNGGFACTFDVPTSPLGSLAITTSEGPYNTTVSFLVLPSPSAAPAAFPWWVVAVAGVVVVALLMVLIVVVPGRRAGPRPHGARPRPGGALRAWGGTPASGAAGGLSGTETLSAVAGGASAAATPGNGALGAGVGVGPEEDIDVLITRLEKISLDLFKKKPHELVVDEHIETTAAASAEGK